MTAPRKRLRDHLLPALVGAGGPLLLRALACTWRVRRIGLHPFLDRRKGDPRCFVVAFWHSTLLAFTWLHRGEGASVVVSRHGDGELIARVLERLGYSVARGSSTRGGARAARELLRHAAQRPVDLGITPDGPKGPARRARDGVVYVASRSGLPILPIAQVAERAWRLRSWDRFEIPKPFSRIAVATGDAIEVPADVDRAAVTAFVARYEAEMARAEERAKELLQSRW